MQSVDLSVRIDSSRGKPESQFIHTGKVALGVVDFIFSLFLISLKHTVHYNTPALSVVCNFALNVIV